MWNVVTCTDSMNHVWCCSKQATYQWTQVQQCCQAPRGYPECTVQHVPAIYTAAEQLQGPMHKRVGRLLLGWTGCELTMAAYAEGSMLDGVPPD
jgi:hypothetical protein